MSTSARKRPVHVSVVSRERETSDRLVKRFLKKCKKTKIHDMILQKSPWSAVYEKDSDKKRREKIRLTHKCKKEQEELDSEDK